MRLRTLLAACAAALPGVGLAAPTPDRDAHAAALVLDTHIDTPLLLETPGWDFSARHDVRVDGSQVDLPRMRDGGVDGGFFALFTPQGERSAQGDAAALDYALRRAMRLREMVAARAGELEIAYTADDARRIAASGKRFVFLSMENGAPVGRDLARMQTFHALGVRLMGPVHSADNDLADSATGRGGWGGLSPLGRQWVAEANRLGILIDASHASDAAFDQMLALSKAPLILSHSAMRAISANPRNIDDDRLRALAAKGGVVQVNVVSMFMVREPEIPARVAALADLDRRYPFDAGLTDAQLRDVQAARAEIDRRWPVPRATLDDVMKHIFHAIEVAGIDHVGLSGDFDGGGGVDGLEDISKLPKITERLFAAGYSPDDIAKFWGGNALRVLSNAQALAKRSPRASVN